MLCGAGDGPRRAARSSASIRGSWTYGWLTLAGVFYAIAWLPMGWFWGRVLAALGQPIAWLEHAAGVLPRPLGKYVPGKALVLVIRIGLIASSG